LRSSGSGIFPISFDFPDGHTTIFIPVTGRGGTRAGLFVENGSPVRSETEIGEELMSTLSRRHGGFPLLITILASVLCGGCAYSYVDDDGSRRLVGFVDMRIQAAPEETYAGNVVDLRTLGLSVNENEQGTNVSVGYSREITAAIRNHALVKGNPFQVSEAVNGKNQKNGETGQ
jgi:hypothetical protein